MKEKQAFEITLSPKSPTGEREREIAKIRDSCIPKYREYPVVYSRCIEHNCFTSFFKRSHLLSFLVHRYCITDRCNIDERIPNS